MNMMDVLVNNYIAIIWNEETLENGPLQ